MGQVDLLHSSERNLDVDVCIGARHFIGEVQRSWSLALALAVMYCTCGGESFALSGVCVCACMGWGWGLRGYVCKCLCSVCFLVM